MNELQIKQKASKETNGYSTDQKNLSRVENTLTNFYILLTSCRGGVFFFFPTKKKALI